MIDSVKPSSESSSTHVVVEAPSTANERSVVQFNQALSGDTGQSNTGGGSRDENADADNKTPVTAAAPATAAPVNATPRPAIPPDLNTPEGFSRWRDERLQLTGKSALDDKDFQALAARSVDNLTQKMSREDYSMTGADHAAMTVRTAHDNALDSGFITPAYNGKQFLEQLPDAYYHALLPATGEQLKVGEMQALITEYAQLQPQHQDPAAKARLDVINQQLEPYREAYSYREPYFDSTSDSPAWITAQRQNYRFEGSRADFRAAVGKDMTITQQQTHRVSGGELLNAIAENTRYGHVAGADNNKNGAFDPTKDRRGLSGFVSGFIENVIENPVIRAVAQVAQFTPLAPVATAFNTVAAIHDTVQAVEDGNISNALSSAAGVAVGAGKITGSATITNTAGSLRDASTLASIIEDPKKAALDYASGKVATYVGHGDNGKSPFGDAKPLAHGITQGAIQELRGGEFRSGFAGAMATPLANSLSETLGMTGRSSLATQQRMMLAGVAGGIAAELVGGDFQEGMASARFVTFFNDEASQRLAERALEKVRYFNSYDEMLNHDAGDATVAPFQGSKANIEATIRRYADSPNGYETLSNLLESDDYLNIIYEKGEPKGVGSVLYWDGLDRKPSFGFMPADVIFAHEIGHTNAGGGWNDHPGTTLPGPLGNVEHHENTYRTWANLPEREYYKDSSTGVCYSPEGQKMEHCP